MVNTRRVRWLVIGLAGGLLMGSATGANLSGPDTDPITDTGDPVVREDREENDPVEPSADILPAVNLRFGQPTSETPDFQRHVGPLLGRLGCNGRACHGSFQGQGGFQLSLFGYDFDTDHRALMQEDSWRVNVGDPEESLILTKPTDADWHGGGLRYEEDGWQYQLLKNWIRGGAENRAGAQRLIRLEVHPPEIVTGPGQTHPIQVVATWSDGVREDVTPLVRFQSNDPQVAAIDEAGIVTGRATGDTHLVVFYDNEVVSVPVLAPVPGASEPVPGSPAPERFTFDNPSRIDELVLDKLNKLRIEPSPVSDDATFLRRVSLDIAGTLPAPDEIREFLADEDPGKRSQKIEELLQSKAYVAWWTTFLCDLTGNNSQQLRNVAYTDLPATAWYRWIYQRIEQNMPYDEIVEGIVLSSSRLEGESLTGYSRRMSEDARDKSTRLAAQAPTMPYYWMRQGFRDGDTLAISFAHAFLGVRLQCAQCHKHPFDQWTQDDFRQFARFFSGVAISQARRVSSEEQQELQTILDELEIDLRKMNGGQVRRSFAEAIRQGKTVPFPELVAGRPRKSREELQREQAEMQTQMQEQEQDREAGKDAGGTTDDPPLTRQQRQRRQRERRREMQRRRNRNRFYTDAILLGSDSVQLSDFADARQPAMQWLRHEQNPYFARAIVNRIWARYFGVGIVEPADDLNLANPPSNGPLLEYLASGFVASGYDLKWVHREIANSKVYQLTWETTATNRQDRRNFSHALPRRLPAEVVFDAISQAAAAPARNRQFREQLDQRAIAIPGTISNSRSRQNPANPGFAMQIFGRSQRANSCDCDRSGETSLIQTVYLQNDRDIHQLLGHPASWLGQLRGELGGQALSRSEHKQLARNEERLRKLRLNLRKARTRQDAEKVAGLQRQVRQLNQRLAPLRQRARNRVKGKPLEPDQERLITEAWLRTLSRFPTPQELDRCREYMAADSDFVNALTGIMWSLVNTREFIVNH